MSEAYKTQLFRGLIDALITAATVALTAYSQSADTRQIVVPAVTAFIGTLTVRLGYDGTVEHQKAVAQEDAVKHATGQDRLVPPAELP